jgi:nitrogen fixation/metabolism regulation signal transduction histidine kinase
MLVLAFVVTGVVAIYSDIEQSKNFNQQQLERKEKSVRASLEHFLIHLGGHLNTDSVSYEFGDKICELSDVHDMFIGMFDLNGRYLISNNSLYLDSLEISSVVPKHILSKIQGGFCKRIVDTTYNHLNHVLVYWVFQDINQKPISITAVAYDPNEEDPKGVEDFLVSISGIYILLFFLAAIIAYFLSKYITRSLGLVTKKLHATKLGTKNEPLPWNTDDEIGKLVIEYNRMLFELQKSAEKLAEKEREGAWREMAQQIAHDIKNPLTPMRLRVQHLERYYSDHSSIDFQDHLKKFCVTMIDQIDTLANIASAFSQFASSTVANPEILNINQAVLKLIPLFKSEDYYLLYNNSYLFSNIFIDPAHFQRILTNLITNAVQAKLETTELLISISVRCTNDFCTIKISDNGCGIPLENKTRLFQPHFTTKTTGTGIGLATVKSLIENAGGVIKYKSRMNKGTTFFLFFPVVKPL